MHYLKAVVIGLVVFGVFAGMIILGLAWPEVGPFSAGDREDIENAPDEDVYSFMQYTRSSDGRIHPWREWVVLQEFMVPADFSPPKGAYFRRNQGRRD